SACAPAAEQSADRAERAAAVHRLGGAAWPQAQAGQRAGGCARHRQRGASGGGLIQLSILLLGAAIVETRVAWGAALVVILGAAFVSRMGRHDARALADFV